MNLQFEPDGIRRAGTALQQDASASVRSTQRKLSVAGNLSLPPLLAEQQAQVNAIIQNAVAEVGVLAELADSFRERMYLSAAAYERVEQGNVQASSDIRKEL